MRVERELDLRKIVHSMRTLGPKDLFHGVTRFGHAFEAQWDGGFIRVTIARR